MAPEGKFVKGKCALDKFRGHDAALLRLGRGAVNRGCKRLLFLVFGGLCVSGQHIMPPAGVYGGCASCFWRASFPHVHMPGRILGAGGFRFSSFGFRRFFGRGLPLLPFFASAVSARSRLRAHTSNAAFRVSASRGACGPLVFAICLLWLRPGRGVWPVLPCLRCPCFLPARTQAGHRLALPSPGFVSARLSFRAVSSPP